MLDALARGIADLRGHFLFNGHLRNFVIIFQQISGIHSDIGSLGGGIDRFDLILIVLIDILNVAQNLVSERQAGGFPVGWFASLDEGTGELAPGVVPPTACCVSLEESIA